MHQSKNLNSPYIIFSKEEWADLGFGATLNLTENEIIELRGLNEPMSIDEVRDVYLPISRLLNLYISGTEKLFEATNLFLGKKNFKVPFIIGIGGSVAVGKSTTSRILQALLSKWSDNITVSLVNTDGFLMSNNNLEKRSLMERKGFPESYNLTLLLDFLNSVKSGKSNVKAPVYSHLLYDNVPGEFINVNKPDILIIEGLNVLQPAPLPRDGNAIPYVSDFFDFSIFVDADEKNIKNWYIQRFLKLKSTAFREEKSYFNKYSYLSDEEAVNVATSLWEKINYVNLIENILPTRQRANLILRKSENHSVNQISLRKL
ncbi:MAG: type I pantothenate kinase [Pseudomonadota bacterium]|nr:type I pantothenate kinase [Pseudomonadota bacterium]MEC7090303.1 type I pantothenate kinase [Pseudomonadota bacterium]MEC7270332.1 type I pantothenate kinase [Pseudomonadota bacterium]MEC8452627.1 type I pantothenate kinase [Pseudomonadota bacterium]|tara:strand:- start:328 stop:1278 length:951 start_codon:yes stop_codon:yes gene_type:complete